jgi:hypothetical protein
MRIILALVALAATPAIAQGSPLTVKPSRVPFLCAESAEQISGLTKVCYYNCARSEGAMTVTTYEACPRWTPRWRLNRNGSHFGPSVNAR